MIDVSEFQGTINWPKVPKTERVLIRVSYGTTGVDKHGAQNVQGASAAGLQFGVYHFLEDNDPNEEIAHFLATSGRPQHSFGLRGMIDVEPSEFSHPTFARVQGAIDAYHKAVDYWPIVYGNTGVLSGLKLAGRSAACPLMIADYGPNDGARHPISGATPAPWTNVDVHQYTSVGSCSGVGGHVDESVILTKGTIQVPKPRLVIDKYKIGFRRANGDLDHVWTRTPIAWQRVHPKACRRGRVCRYPHRKEV